ncbi:hypothetical protein GS481_02780 [Rhodococcus hoagii]|nr:hypothetical protein [Prescottella equi]
MNYQPPEPKAKAPFSRHHLFESLRKWARENVDRFDDPDEFLAATHVYAEAQVTKFSPTLGGLALDLTDEVVDATATGCAQWWWRHSKR